MLFLGNGGPGFDACGADGSVSVIEAWGHDYMCALYISHLTSAWSLRSHTSPGGEDNIRSF